MRRRTLGLGVLAVAIVSAAPVGAAVSTTTTLPKIDILGGSSFVKNRYIQEKTRFAKDVYALKSGSQIKIVSKTPGEGHTVSVVGLTDLPKTTKDFDKCYERGICGKLAGAHGFPEGEGPPTTPLVNQGAPGFDKKGDSLAIGPAAPDNKGSVKLTAKKGTTLYLICIIHPWMQAKITVK